MRKLRLSMCLAFLFFVASAIAQTRPSGGASPSSQPGPYPTQQPGMSQPGNSAPNDQGTTNTNTNTARKIKGCVQSEGGQYVLATKKGKQIPLTGQDVSAHVGHEVALKGNWESSNQAASSNAGAQKTFNVTGVDMISETCTAKGKGNMSNSSGTSTQGTTGTQPPPQ
jgi:hypothetical protein